VILAAQQPGQAPVRLDVADKISRLHSPAAQGKNFLVISCASTLEMAEWITASFWGPLAAVPVSPQLPPAARDLLLAQLPRGRWVHCQELAEQSPPPQVLAQEKKLGALWAVIFTSGSSGAPKGIALSGAALRNSALSHREHSGNPPWLLNLPLYHIGGFSILSRAFFLGGPVGLMQEKFSPQAVEKWIEGGIRGISLVPTQLFRMLEFKSRGWEGLEIALLGGAATPDSLLRAGLEAGIPLRKTYGLTENCSQVATETDPHSGMRLLPGTSVKISPGGEIFLRSNRLAEGIYSGGELLPLEKQEGFFPTRDLGRLEGDVLTVEGRLSEVIHCGGVKIFPSQIEPLLATIPGIEDAAVTGLADPEWGEIVCAAFVGEEMGPEQAKESLQGRLEPRLIPKKWVRLSRIPRSEAGKVRRRELAKMIERALDSFRA
jgi:O-succinylbenzoic acid--CoA ligase